ncbi:MAG: polyphosphate kinase 1, partial [Planctomycetes bacterium]|nr:polyphosphate kinase 1 [Planctomycetota bacterium]
MPESPLSSAAYNEASEAETRRRNSHKTWNNPDPALDRPELYLNRELSLLQFNRRVMELAQDPNIPLLERLRFLTISSSNLDEFFEIRAAGVKQQIEYGVVGLSPDGRTPQQLNEEINSQGHRLVAEQYRILGDELLPALRYAGVALLKREEWSDRQVEWLEEYFNDQVLPVLTPIAIDPAHPFPRILNKSLNFIVELSGVDAFGRDSRIAVIQVPRSLPRVIRLPREICEHSHSFVLLSAVISASVPLLFPGMKVEGAWQFRVTRNSDLFVEEEDVDDLLSAIKGELDQRKWGDAVRLEVANNIPKSMTRFLLQHFELTEEDVYRVEVPVNLHRLSAIVESVDNPDIKYPAFVPGGPLEALEEDVFRQIRRGDVLLHHPYQSFAPVVDMIRQAANDPDVLSIKITLYRTGANSPIVDALIAAARNQKDVTVVIELRARFDEAANIDLATRLQNAGANVAYGIVGYKAHAKLLLVVRREKGKLRRYCHLGTGNYHTGTARAYTDFSLMTCDKAIGRDVHHLFLQLTGIGMETKLKKLLQSPFSLEPKLHEHIDREIEVSRAGGSGRIIARM